MLSLVSLCVTLCAATTALAATQDIHSSKLRKFEFRISVDVSGRDVMHDRIQSYLSREFRKLGDVVVTEDEALFSLSVIALAPKMSDSRELGYAIAYKFSRLPTAIRGYASVVQTDVIRDFLLNALDVQEEVLTFKLLFGPKDNLEDACKDIVAGIDVGEFETMRRRR